MNPINATASTKQAPAKTSLSKTKSKVKVSKVKVMIANRGPTATGALKVQQMLEGTFVNGSDSMIHAAPLPFKGVYFTCLCCYLVGLEKQYSGITYTQSHGRNCANRPTFINWLSGHTELHHLIPQCIEIEEFDRDVTSLPVEEDQPFSISHLHQLQASFNSKVTDMKEAADLLSEYTKKATETVPIKTATNTAAPPTPPLPPPTVVASTTVKPPTVGLVASHPKRNHKPSVKALEAKQSI